MKKIVVICIALLAGYFCIKMVRFFVEEKAAQEEEVRNSTHLKFKGVPIDGSLKDFTWRMEECGFKPVFSMDDGKAIFRGDFADIKNCIVHVETLSSSDLVSSIRVVLCTSVEWSTLKSNYFHVKDLLAQKYGEPTSSVEEFKPEHGRYPSDDTDALSALRDGRCNYNTIYELDNGTIKLKIDFVWESTGYLREHGSFVVLQYLDKENNESVRNAALKDL